MASTHHTRSPKSEVTQSCLRSSTPTWPSREPSGKTELFNCALIHLGTYPEKCSVLPVNFITLLPPLRSPPSFTPSSYLPPPIIPPHTPHLYPPSTSSSLPSLLLRSYQVRGHLAAQIDPLGLNNMEREKAKKMIIRSVTVDQKVGWLELILEY